MATLGSWTLFGEGDGQHIFVWFDIGLVGLDDLEKLGDNL